MNRSNLRSRSRILVVERSPALRADIRQALQRAGFQVEAMERAPCTAPTDALDRFDLSVLGLDGRGVVEGLENGRLTGPVILLGADETMPADRWTRLRAQAVEWLHKPFSVESLESRIVAHLGSGAAGWCRETDPLLQTENPEWRGQLQRVRQWARRSVPVSVIGELGTGRLALARQIHAWSDRAAGPCVAIESAELECDGPSGVAARLMEALSRAEEGTLVWVDPAESSSATQSLALRALRESQPADPRWVTIASQTLDQSVALGRLDLELQYRLEAAHVTVPAFRDRPEDQQAICAALSGRIARELGLPSPEIDRALVERLGQGGFVGNRFGLENRLRAALIRSVGQPEAFRSFLERQAGGLIPAQDDAGSAPSLNLKTLERETIVRALAHWEGNRTRASESLGISVRTLRNKIHEYSLR